MKVVNVEQVPKVTLVTPLFTSPDVSIQPLAPEGSAYNMSVVTFGKGVRNKFHAHESDQVLIVTAGRGIVATEDEEREVTTGDVILFAAGEKHWHGATEDCEFSHIYVHLAGAGTKQLEK
jgi:quercetin dioxygenase-like cupin family protein